MTHPLFIKTFEQQGRPVFSKIMQHKELFSLKKGEDNHTSEKKTIGHFILYTLSLFETKFIYITVYSVTVYISHVKYVPAVRIGSQ